MIKPILYALIATMFTFLGTVIGSAAVFFTKKKSNPKFMRFFLGFASGVMIAASVWSLIIPSINLAQTMGIPSLLPSCLGISIGAIFLFILDAILPKNNSVACALGLRKQAPHKQTNMLMFAVTLHNIPEGIAVGLSFALGAMNGTVAGLAPAITLAAGMMLQNIPEGAAISLPYKNAGKSKFQSFLLGSLSGAVEPIFGVLGVLAISATQTLMPWLLAFAGGAMFYVVFDELIPESKQDNSHEGVFGAIIGFIIMMALDILLG